MTHFRKNLIRPVKIVVALICKKCLRHDHYGHMDGTRVFTLLNPKPSDLWNKGVAQLVDHLLPTSEICGSNTVIGKFCVLSTVSKRRK